MFKVALVGVGGISGVHIPAWESMEDAQLVALCDIRPERMNKYEGKAHYVDFDEMLANEEIDILDICLPTFLHVEFALKALNKGINVICEKPLSLNSDEIELLYSTAEKNGVKIMAAQVIRFWREYEVLKEIYETERYGKLLSGSMSRLGCRPMSSWNNWMLDEELSGLVPFDLHIHDADFIYYCFGFPKNTTKFRAKRPEQDYLEVVYEYDDFFVTADASWFASPYPFRASFLFQFEKAVVAYEGGKLTVYESGGGAKGLDELVGAVNEEAGQSGTDEYELPSTDAYGNEIRYFAECVRKNKPVDKVPAAELAAVIKLLRSL